MINQLTKYSKFKIILNYYQSKLVNIVSLHSEPSLQNLTIGSIENESNNFMNIASFSIKGIINLCNRLIARSSEIRNNDNW